MALIGLASAALGQATAPAAGPERVVSCGAVERREVVRSVGDGSWRGRAVELCRAAAIAAFGPMTRTEFHVYRTVADLAAAATDQLAFLSAAELAIPALRGKLRVGPVIAVEEQALMVPIASTARRREDLRERTICFMIGTGAEDGLDTWALGSGVPVRRLGFQEADEMRDAYAAGKCAALALDRVEAVEDYGAASPANRMLEDELSHVPIHAAVPVTAEPAWTAIVDDLGKRAP